MRHKKVKQPLMYKAIKQTGSFLFLNIEAIIWVSAILYFAISPVHSESHFTICPLKLIGFGYCPGCGLGRAMILLLHGNIIESFAMHPLALFALVVLVLRVIIVFRNYFQRKKVISMPANSRSTMII